MSLAVVVLLAAFAAVLGDPITSRASPAAQFWEKALPGSPLPEAIAAAMGRGTQMPPFVSSQASWPQNCFGSYRAGGCSASHTAGDISVSKQVACLGSYKFGNNGCGELGATTGLFFDEAAVKVGNVMTLSSPEAPVISILPRKVADMIPFENISSSSSNTTDVLLQLFHILPGSPAAADVEATLLKCLEPKVQNKNHKHACATSLEGVVQVAMRMLGTPNLQAVASALPSAGLPRKAYIVKAVRPLSGSLFIACHRQPYPYAIYMCHSTGLSKAFKMSLTPQEGGAMTDLVAICHQETSDWNPNYPAFKALHTKPGGAAICHYAPYGDLIFRKEEASN